MPSELTPRQSEVLTAIVDRMELVGPTVRELMPVLGIGSTNGVTCHLRPLETKGFIIRNELKSRGIRLADPELADGLRITVGGTPFILVPVDKWDV